MIYLQYLHIYIQHNPISRLKALTISLRLKAITHLETLPRSGIINTDVLTARQPGAALRVTKKQRDILYLQVPQVAGLKTLNFITQLLFIKTFIYNHCISTLKTIKQYKYTG